MGAGQFGRSVHRLQSRFPVPVQRCLLERLSGAVPGATGGVICCDIIEVLSRRLQDAFPADIPATDEHRPGSRREHRAGDDEELIPVGITPDSVICCTGKTGEHHMLGAGVRQRHPAGQIASILAPVLLRGDHAEGAAFFHSGRLRPDHHLIEHGIEEICGDVEPLGDIDDRGRDLLIVSHLSRRPFGFETIAQRAGKDSRSAPLLVRPLCLKGERERGGVADCPQVKQRLGSVGSRSKAQQFERSVPENAIGDDNDLALLAQRREVELRQPIGADLVSSLLPILFGNQLGVKAPLAEVGVLHQLVDLASNLFQGLKRKQLGALNVDCEKVHGFARSNCVDHQLVGLNLTPHAGRRDDRGETHRSCLPAEGKASQSRLLGL